MSLKPAHCTPQRTWSSPKFSPVSKRDLFLYLCFLVIFNLEVALKQRMIKLILRVCGLSAQKVQCLSRFTAVKCSASCPCPTNWDSPPFCSHPFQSTVLRSLLLHLQSNRAGDCQGRRRAQRSERKQLTESKLLWVSGKFEVVRLGAASQRALVFFSTEKGWCVQPIAHCACLHSSCAAQRQH